MTPDAIPGSRLVAEATVVLRAAGVDSPGGDARRLLAHALGIAPDRLTLVLSDPVAPAAQARFDALIARRAARVPVAQLTGQRAFRGRNFAVTADVLDPRPDTEALVDAALSGPFERVLDLGTGSGCILLTLLAERPGARGVGVDASPLALAVAARNATALGVADRASLILSDWFSAVTGTFDLIVSNPPYIALSELAGLAPEVRDHEPRMALTDGGDGLGAYRAILTAAPGHLAPGGRLAVEIGPTQAAAIRALGQAAGLGAGAVLPDLDGRDRVVVFAPGPAQP